MTNFKHVVKFREDWFKIVTCRRQTNRQTERGENVTSFTFGGGGKRRDSEWAFTWVVQPLEPPSTIYAKCYSFLMIKQDQLAVLVPDVQPILAAHSLFSPGDGMGLYNSIQRCSESVRSCDYCQPLNQRCVHSATWMQIPQPRTTQNVKWLTWCLCHMAFFHRSLPVTIWRIIHWLHRP